GDSGTLSGHGVALCGVQRMDVALVCAPRSALSGLMTALALADHTKEALLCPTRISPDMSLRLPESIIQPDWLALLEGMILACPATYITLAQGLYGNGGGACYPGPVNT
ncbi:hypothetical protein KUCAC02_014554, partial [Chaenocephalus aceratus]